MLGKEPKEHLQIRIQGWRQDYLDAQRGPTTDYEKVRHYTQMLVDATGARNGVPELVEGVMIQLIQSLRATFADEVKEAERKAIACTRERYRREIEKIL